MTKMWIGHPGSQPPSSPRLLKSIETEHAAFNEIDRLGNLSSCRICSSESGLTKEHSPSKAAFNKAKLIGLSALEPITTRFLKWKAHILQSGSQHESLCKNCNNNTGSWYNPTYVKFVRICSRFAKENNACKTVDINAHIYPARLFRQALTHICATCQPGLSLRYPNLKEIILNKEKSLAINPLKIGLFIRVNRGGRHSGISIFVNTVEETSRLIAEFSFWPLGWIVTFDNLPFEGTLDVTNWSAMSTDEKLHLDIRIPCQWCVSPYPGDFRQPKEV